MSPQSTPPTPAPCAPASDAGFGALPAPNPVPLPGRPPRDHRAVMRWLWIAAGAVACAIGFVGLVVPGLPSTVFFILAAGCFSRGSDRMYNWLVSLPHVGSLVRDYHAGLGMPRSAKIWATVIMGVCVAAGSLALPAWWQVAIAFGAAGIGAACIWFFIPTRTQRPP